MYLPVFPDYYWGNQTDEKEGSELFANSLMTYFVELVVGKTKIQSKIGVDDFHKLTYDQKFITR